MSSPAEGPFRADPRDRIDVEVPPFGEAQKLVRAARPGIEVPTYLAIIALATLGMAAALDAILGYVTALAIAGLAILGYRENARVRRLYEAIPSNRKRCRLDDEGVLLEGPSGSTRWRWPAVRAVWRFEDVFVLELSTRQALAIRASGAKRARVEAWLAARVSRSMHPPVGLILLLLAILYVLTAAACVVVLPSIVPP